MNFFHVNHIFPVGNPGRESRGSRSLPTELQRPHRKRLGQPTHNHGPFVRN